ncbi:MAG: hypothetical protein MRY78_05130 [Saprospiraceae bacterium]|nr:hypothetical protein [Saprospiraceae bacterium]
MAYVVIVSDENSTGTVVNQIHLSFDAPSISVEELIKARVEQELESHHSQEKATTSDITSRQLDKKNSRHIALGPFRENGFFIRVNGKAMDQLNEEIKLHPNTDIRFVQIR